MSNNSDSETREAIRETVCKAYAQIAVKGKSCCGSGQSCCGYSSPTALATYQEATGQWNVMLSASSYAVARASLGGPGIVPVQ